MLLDKIVEKGLSVGDTFAICERVYDPENITIGDALWIKNVLSLSDNEAIEIFLS